MLSQSRIVLHGPSDSNLPDFENEDKLTLARTVSERFQRNPALSRRRYTSHTISPRKDFRHTKARDLPNGLTSKPLTRANSVPDIILQVENDKLEGVGGSYLVHDSLGKKYIFKPNSEEAYDEALDENGQSIRLPKKKGVKYGQTAVKEFVAHILDQGWAGVPPTILVGGQLESKTAPLKTNIAHRMIKPAREDPETVAPSPTKSTVAKKRAYIPPALRRKLQMQEKKQTLAHERALVPANSSGAKSTALPPGGIAKAFDLRSRHLAPRKFGSLQSYIENIGSSEDIGPSKFSVKDVHRIGVLDIRLCNLDRHLGNILVSKIDHNRSIKGNQGDNEFDNKYKDSDYKLVPIDHAYILPDFRHLEEVNFEWLNWKQTKVPFSQDTLDYIKSLNPFEDAAKVKMLGLEDSSAMTLIITTLFLQHCAKQGLTLWEIGNLIQRHGMGNEKSVLEKVVQSAMTQYKKKAMEMIREPYSLGREDGGHRITSKYDLRWSRKLDVFLKLIHDAIKSKLDHYPAQILHEEGESEEAD
eukprot:CAMPEP_0184481734 /NCGR_PEP_ID=MMETSP0113_2-20130426/3302_1 /TAXON_ID=91329 /ORGANISM="Norrisiella sphaerica, Strain BC52" /LENGTH=527 /DNA_ID=CAMNT_0026861043 /DNA_START=124 /DNA_END=1707 /DNA_ORIENTATION=+